MSRGRLIGRIYYEPKEAYDLMALIFKYPTSHEVIMDISNDLFMDEFGNITDFDHSAYNLPSSSKSTAKTAVKHLKTAYLKEKLCLVLGSGISLNFGIPTWNNLLQRLLIDTIKTKPDKAIDLSRLFSLAFNPSPLIAGRYLQECNASEAKEKNIFENEVRKALYDTFREDADCPIVDEIVKFCLSPGNSPNLDSIITYNYDDIIESKLREKELDMPFESVYGQSLNPDDETLKIYHVHGFLPRKGKITSDNKITLGEFVYHEQYNDTYSWNNIVQINKFRDTTCLFIGTSLEDPNIRRLLDISNAQKKRRKYHYILRKRIDKAWLKNILDKIVSENPEIARKSNFQIEEAIEFLAEMKERFDEKDSESLGVKTVWVSDYDTEIPKLLREIRISN